MKIRDRARYASLKIQLIKLIWLTPWPRYWAGEFLYLAYHRSALGCYRCLRALRSRLNPAGGVMPNTQKFNFREWLVPPILLPIVFGLLIAATVVLQ
jgi:hypothetical protein